MTDIGSRLLEVAEKVCSACKQAAIAAARPLTRAQSAAATSTSMVTLSATSLALSSSQPAKPAFYDPASAPAYLIAGLLACVVGVVVISGRFSLDVRWASDISTVVAFVVALAWLMRHAGHSRVAGFVEASAVFFGLSILAPLCAVIMASTDLPLADDALRTADAYLFGFDRAVVATWLEPRSIASRAWGWIYNSLTFQPVVLFGALFFSKRDRGAWTLVTAWGAALFLSLAIFPLLPAFGTPPYVLDFVDVLRGARDGNLRQLGVGALTGIITFPSFHAAAATMLGWGFLTLGRWAWPMVALNVAMFASALVVGGHYLVDLPAGALVAVTSITAARACRPKTAGSGAENARRGQPDSGMERPADLSREIDKRPKSADSRLP